jgi:aspartate/methionine/tyrosine aminotransferase
MFLKKIDKPGTALMMEKATKLGFSFENQDWVNFGQGSPELGEIKGDLVRIKNINSEKSCGYTPVSGRTDLKEKIANYYNFIKKDGQKLTRQNVSVAGGGGRGAILRVLASLSKNLKVGFLNPDYTGYKGFFELFENLNFIPINLSKENGFKIDLNKIKTEIKTKSLQAIFFSNPSNPTGQKLTEYELEELLEFCNQEKCLLIHDEFYSKFIYDQKGKIFSAINHLKNIENSNLVILDGLTKGWRYPGFRLSWIIASKKNTEVFNSLGAIFDGGASHPIQQAALDLFDTTKIQEQNLALQENFDIKRKYLIQNLVKLGFLIKSEPMGGFYVFADISKFLEKYQDDLNFCQQLLKQKIILIPGRFFDIDFNKKEPNFKNFVRFSYGLEFHKIKQGVEMLEKILSPSPF